MQEESNAPHTESEGEASTQAGKISPSFGSGQKPEPELRIVIDTKENLPKAPEGEVKQQLTEEPFATKPIIPLQNLRFQYADFFEETARKNHKLLDTITNSKFNIKFSKSLIVGYKRCLRKARKELAQNMGKDSDLSSLEDTSADII